MKEKLLTQIEDYINLDNIINKIIDIESIIKIGDVNKITNRNGIILLIKQYLVDLFTEDELLDLYKLVKIESNKKLIKKLFNIIYDDINNIIKYWIDKYIIYTK